VQATGGGPLSAVWSTSSSEGIDDLRRRASLVGHGQPVPRTWDWAGWARTNELEQVVELSAAEAHNRCFQFVRAGQRRFLKVYGDPAYSVREWAMLALLVGDAPRLEACGHWDGHDWSAFEWADLVPVALDEPAGPEAFAAAVSRVHAHPVPAVHALPEASRPADVWSGRIDLLEEASPDDLVHLDGVRDEVERAVAALDQAWSRPLVLLHGDVVAHNLVRHADVAGGAAFLIDFERSAVGPREYDLGRAWCTDLVDPERRRRFLATYRAEAGIGDPAWPDPMAIWFLGLVHATGLVAFAARTGLGRLHAQARACLVDTVRQVPR
jgi:hypothetical protein